MQRYKTIVYVCLFLKLVMGGNPLQANGAKKNRDQALFKTKCAQCHSLSDALKLGSQYLPSEIKKLVTRMSKMPKASINDKEQEAITIYLINYVYAKKQTQLKKALGTLPEPKKEAELKKLKAALARYK